MSELGDHELGVHELGRQEAGGIPVIPQQEPDWESELEDPLARPYLDRDHDQKYQDEHPDRPLIDPPSS
jgi:hypothetical protein